MTWFLKDSLKFLSYEESLGTLRASWISGWQKHELSDQRIKQWLPEDDY
jgi:hypothetical protein